MEIKKEIVETKLLQLMLRAIRDKKGSDIVCLNLKGQSDLCDYKVICSGENERQTKAIAESVEALCYQHFKMKPSSIEGKSSGYWILLDYGSTMLHIFQKDYRNYYALEKLWPNAGMNIVETV